MIKRFFPYTYFIAVIALFFYSFTQVDLSLTLSSAGALQSIQKSFQEIGYFNRPLSAEIFIVILIALFGFYIYFLYLAYKNKIDKKKIWVLIIGTAIILAPSYTAFSHDIFNYIFDAKIITYYHQNPYLHKALDYPGDPMLSFMHWTHRLYPYGPAWLVVTVPVSFIGMNIFVVTYFLFKILIVGFYLGCVYLLGKVAQKISINDEKFILVLFALNPLLIIEALVTAHNDVAMMFFAIWGIYLFFIRKRIFAMVLIVISALIKIPTLVLLAPIVLSFIPNIREKLDDQKYVWLFILFSVAGLIYSMTKLEIQPWYFLWLFPFACLLKPNKYIVSLLIGITLGLLLRYAAFLFYGNWDDVVLRNSLTIAATMLPISLVCIHDLTIKSLKVGSKK